MPLRPTSSARLSSVEGVVGGYFGSNAVHLRLSAQCLELETQIHASCLKAMTTTQLSSPPANWYPDPGNYSQLRYWDGLQWTNHRHQARRTEPFPEPPAGTVPASSSRRMLSWSIDVITPIVGGLFLVMVAISQLPPDTGRTSTSSTAPMAEVFEILAVTFVASWVALEIAFITVICRSIGEWLTSIKTVRMDDGTFSRPRRLAKSALSLSLLAIPLLFCAEAYRSTCNTCGRRPIDETCGVIVVNG